MWLGPSWILIRILHGSVYKSYMDLYVDLIWVVYMLMCSQLIQNVNISLEIYELCPGWKFLKNVNISFEICANVFTADPNC